MSPEEDLVKSMYEWTEKYAKKMGFKLNPDKEALAYVLEGLATRKVKFGRRYCPCRVVTGDEEEDRKIICPCIYHKDEIEQDGKCHCELFFKGD